jgi:hypothetical protein
MKTLILSLFSAISLCSYSQGLMTIGEVFDFNIGDKFHYRLPPESVPPAIDRITITGKYFSTDGDTVFYVRYHDSYWTEVDWDTFPPQLLYHFYTESDTVNYTDLDSLISFYDTGFQCDTMYFECDTSVYNSTEYCGRLINGYYVAANEFEPEIYQKEYGKGIGWVWNYYYSSSSLPPGVQWDSELFYYQKDGIDCGTPDTMTVSTPELDSEGTIILIYPNPAHDFIYISIPLKIGEITFTLTDLSGKEILRKSFKGPSTNKILLTSYDPGVYIGIVETYLGRKVVKLIIE